MKARRRRIAGPTGAANNDGFPIENAMSRLPLQTVESAPEASRPFLQKSQRVTNALAAVGLEHARHSLPSQLSGGMAQRAALARCLAREPRALLLDEPFGALDEVTRADMQQLLIAAVRNTGASALFVTHDIDEALLVADQIVLLGNRGTLVGRWAVELPQPRHTQVRSLGELRISILQALQNSISEAA